MNLVTPFRKPEQDEAGPVAGGPAPSGLAELLLVLRRRKGLIIGTVCITFTLATLTLVVLPPRYKADAIVMIDPREQKVVDFDAVLSGLNPDEESIQSEIQVLSSERLLRGVIREMKLVDVPELNTSLDPGAVGAFVGGVMTSLADAGAELHDLVLGASSNPPHAADPNERTELNVLERVVDNLDVDVIGRSRAIKIDFTSKDPFLAAGVANTIANDYILRQAQSTFDATNEASKWISARVDALRAEVEEADRKLESYRSSSALAGGRSSDDIDDQLKGLNADYVATRTQYDQESSKLARIESVLSSKGIVEAGKLLDSPLIQTLETQEAQLAQIGADLAQKFGPLYPDFKSNLAQRNAVTRQIENEIQKIIATERNEVRVLGDHVAADNKTLDELRAAAAQIGDAEVTLRALKSDADAKHEVLQDFLERSQQLKQAGQQPINARVIAEATPPTKASFPKLPILLPVALLMSLAVAAGLAAAAEALERGLLSGDQIRRDLGTDLLAMVPRVRNRFLRRRGGIAAVLRNRDPEHAESVGALMTALSLTLGRQHGNTILFTSAVPHEGKTALIVSLARRLARSGKRVLVLDCDLRSPRIHEYFELPNTRGVSDVIAGIVSASDIIMRDKASGAEVMSAGTAAPHGEEYAALPQLRGVIASVQRDYDYVLVDTPPVLAVSDARIVAAGVHHCVFVARWRKTSRAAVAEGIDLMRGAGARILGVALTFVDAKVSEKYGICHTGHYPGAKADYVDLDRRRLRA